MPEPPRFHAQHRDGSVDPTRHESGALFINLAVALTVVAVLGMMAFICYRWATVPEPTTAIVIEGDPSLDHAEVLVDSLQGSETPSKQVKVTLDPSNDHSIPIFRFPGEYHLVVRWGGLDVVNSNVTVGHYQGVRVSLPSVLKVIGDPMQPPADVNVTNGEHTATGKLEHDDQFVWSTLIWPGPCTVEVTRDKTNIYQDTFTVEPHTPRVIDLRKKE